MKTEAMANMFRGMRPEPNGRPQVGRSASQLGVRIPRDIAPDSDGNVSPASGGMSVSPDSWLNIPTHRRPQSMGHGSSGPNTLNVYSIEVKRLSTPPLQLRAEPANSTLHALVEPSERMPLAQFEHILATTQDDWRQVWPLNK